MIIIESQILDEFVEKHADCRKAVQNWINKVEDAEWKSHTDLKMDFPSADYVKNGRYVFNIRGNKYRLIVVVVFVAGQLIVRFIGTHAEYDKINAESV
ncbi:putative membrane protein [Proteiniphilum saccharofermentans]|uniref:Putative membrane protein n=1 Tax=Proteiniphilum saccharofermentans TaxID=1642647 RepID=A0A1R3SUM5_9BACT|nr:MULTISPECIES: type II toxin-antitoxin system HigB family toxin [Proteiniphilum]SEA44176.1 mRNA interferase HigB [Porphyromonadaceae bacterium KH3R12]SFK67408.1 mRNA interferase HigB [Porphyromonadaceae bacterium KH3CP3RA]SFT05688.1 mRNA interferase HigB [Porphyromonadaceae bacterium NLAE-zl-C104]MDY9918675.1 type II toxin-antitoxin system HigB family toxin [Proteiniphilum sp.]SCD20016.1 putative membrane protein [Proteiniphilum saccharofermentans]